MKRAAAAAAAGLALALVSLAGFGCAGKATFAPHAPIRGEISRGSGGVTVNLQDIVLSDESSAVKVRLGLAAAKGARLVDVWLGGGSAAPCGGGTGVSEVIVDEQEAYRAGPADVSGSSHELELQFPQSPSGGWKQQQVALDLQLAIGPQGEPACLRLTVSGTGGPDWR